jgi:Secretion system C-terminal sorting domain/SprB repeat
MRHYLLVIFLVLFFSNSYSRKFYFSSSTGNDSYTLKQAQSSLTPWKSLQKLQSLITNGNSTFLPGDTIAFKRGDIFDNGYSSTSNPSYFTYSSFTWNNLPAEGYTAPSGTQANPIVITNYGTGDLPNFYYPDAIIPTVGGSYAHNVFEFAGVSWIVVDGLQFNDTRFPTSNKELPAYTRSAILFGTWENSKLAINGIDTTWGSNRDTSNRKRLVRNCTVINCTFSNISFAFGSIAGISCKITNNTITNLKSCIDTTGTYDVGAGAFEGVYGFYNEISHNFVKGAWGKSGRVSSTFGLFGVGVDIFCLKYSKINYNTFVDCSGAWEIGNLDRYDINSGAWYDTFAYNKVINCGQMGYIHGGASNNDPFAGNNRNIACFNNVVINNNTSRISGPKFGSDIYNDGQSFANWWFFRSATKCPDNTLPLSNTTWSNPINPPYCNYGGHRLSVQYSTDLIKGNADTLVDLRNNIFYSTVGDQIIYDASRTKFKHRNNVYYAKGGFLNPTTLGGTAGAGEIVTTNQIFIDTSAALPENWDLHLSANSPAISGGLSVGFNTDFEGSTISGNPEIGLYEYNGSSIVSQNLNATSTQGIINCFGGTTTINVSATGGTQPYNGTGTFTVSAGSYNYIVTDAVGHRDTVYVSISQPTAIITNITAPRIITFGGTTTITIMATGGTGTYTYKLNSGLYQASNIFSGVSKGADTIYVKDANGCIASSYITITQPSAPLVANAAAASTTICNGSSTTITVTGSGGTAPYTGTGNFTVTPGTYSYTILDSNGVAATTTITISQYAAITATVTSGTITTYGGYTSLAISNTANGLSPYTYSLNGGIFQTSSSFSNVGAGTHNITIKDNRGCTLVKTISITQPPSTLNCTATASGPILCNGNSVTVNVAATGGTPPYTGTGSFNLPAGSYTYTVTDAAGSIKTSSITISQPTVISPTITAGRIISFGGTTIITVNATGGTGTYTYKLNRGTYQTSNSFTGIPAGEDTLYVKDANNCIASGVIIITQPLSALSANISTPTTTICNGSTAVVNVTGRGGTPPYTGTGTFTVSAGTYTYTVTDSNGVRASSSIIINQYAALTATVTAGTISVYGAKTTVTVSNVANGLSPYSYSINGGAYQTSNIFSNIGAGIHSINIKDSRGCILNNSITISQPPSTLNMTATPSGNILCNGGNITVVVAATGGTPPYIGTGNFSVVAGTRTFNVTDAVGSTKSITLDIAQPTPISYSLSSGRILINGGTTSISVTASGGTGTFTYKLNNGTYQSSNTFNNIHAGTDTVYIKDANGCISTANIVITQPNQLIANYSNTPIACNGGTSIVNINATGGIFPYTGTGTFNQSAGTTTYTIRDSAGATVTLPVTITQPTAMSQPTLTQGAAILTYGASTIVSISGMSGGTSPYTYASDNGAFQTNSTLTTLGGTHIFKVKDANGCLVNKSMFIYQPLKIFFVSKSDQTCAGAANGSLAVRADGGYMPYVFRIFKINGIQTSTTSYPYHADSAFYNLLPNTYTIRVKDSAGVTDTISILIKSTNITCTKTANSFTNEEALKTDNIETYKIIPNPVGNNLNINSNRAEKSNYQFEIFDITGKLIKKQNASYSTTFSLPVDTLQPGYYLLKIKVEKQIHLLKFYKN